MLGSISNDWHQECQVPARFDIVVDLGPERTFVSLVAGHDREPIAVS